MNKWRLIVLAILLLAVVGVGGCFLFPNHPPVASFTVEYNTNTQDPLVVVLDASGSTDPDNDEIVSYMWSFGDEQVDFINPAGFFSRTVSVSSITIRCPVQGTYHLTLVVKDSRGGTSGPVTADMRVPAPTQGT